MAKKKPVLLQFDEQLLDRLDRLTSSQGRSRSAVVREAVERYVVTQTKEERDRQMVEAYTRFPDDDEFKEWAEDSTREMIEEEPW